jgi:hypothetical protein
MVTKPKICSHGINWQSCHRMSFFPSHSHEQYYQAVRRSWRFGQKREVTIDIITSEGERGVMQNLQRKAANAEQMFAHLVSLMGNELSVQKKEHTKTNIQAPSWL